MAIFIGWKAREQPDSRHARQGRARRTFGGTPGAAAETTALLEDPHFGGAKAIG
jgi:hypothetical protein